MATLTIQPATNDSTLWKTDPNANYSTATEIQIVTSGADNRNGILRFDFSALPTGAIISAASLSLKYYDYGADPVGQTVYAYECTRTDWVGAEVSWNNYKSGQAWSTAGGDYTTTDGASIVMPAAATRPVFINWNVLALCQHFQASHSEIANFIIYMNAATTIRFYSSAYTTAADRPKLVITYTAGWTHKIMGISPAKVMGAPVANIAKIMSK